MTNYDYSNAKYTFKENDAWPTNFVSSIMRNSKFEINQFLKANKYSINEKKELANSLDTNSRSMLYFTAYKGNLVSRSISLIRGLA
jgi:hypothetical protein